MVFNSNKAPNKRDVLGTILLSILVGHKRYAHMTSVYCDSVNWLMHRNCNILVILQA